MAKTRQAWGTRLGIIMAGLDLFGALMGFHIDPHHVLFLQGLYKEEDRLESYGQN